MKTPHLLASFAVAVTATAADLKDSSEVAHTWKENTHVGPAPLTMDLSLRRQTVSPPSYATWPVLISDCWPAFQPRVPDPRDKFKLREPLLDSPRNRVPEELPNNVPMPRGAKPWLYGGETYWVTPLAPAQGK